jgi:2-oxoglutarate dehydrogenase E2 component (dihydrolipoamide succinyltransferase)
VSIEVKVPQLPESVTDATLVSWHKKAGEQVRRDENLVDLETDKVVLEVPAPADGVLKEIKAADGATVTGGQVLALLEPGEARASGSDGDGGRPADTATAATAATASTGDSAEAEVEADAEGEDDDAGHLRMGPAARKLVEEHALDPGEISGSGREGRITKSDVLDFLAGQRADSAGLDSESPARQAPSTGTGAVSRVEHRVTMTRLRARIAERLVEAQRTAAMLTTFNEVDMSAVMGLRTRYRDAFEKRHDIKLGFMSFFVKAVIEALRRFPLLNASIDGDEIVYHEYFDIGIAVSTDRGLLVPILRNAEQMSVAQIEQSVTDFAVRGRNGEITMDELTGGTFTITNGGIFGSLMSTPILNPPQSGILGMHKIQERAVVVDGEIVVRPMMYLALSYDHRIVDGREAVQFLVAIKDQLEDPARLILQV